jgi:hypothetical protein
MPNSPVSTPPQKTRKHAAEEINRAMARFPFLVQILRELSHAQVPHPGDDDIRHGCERALTAMLCELARIDPALPGKSSKAEETAQAWLSLPGARGLVDADKLQRMQLFIDCILAPADAGGRGGEISGCR